MVPPKPSSCGLVLGKRSVQVLGTLLWVMPLLVGAAVPAGVPLGRRALSSPGVGGLLGLLPAAVGPLSPLAPAVLTVRASRQVLQSLHFRPLPCALRLLAPAVVGARGTRHEALLCGLLLLPRPGRLANSTSTSAARLLVRLVPMQRDLLLRPIWRPWSSACTLPLHFTRISLGASPEGSCIRGALPWPLMLTVTLLLLPMSQRQLTG